MRESSGIGICNKPDLSLTCLSGAITNVLKFHNIDICEEQLFNSKLLLNLKCIGKNGIASDIKGILISSLNNYNIKMEDIPINNSDELKDAIRKYGVLLMHIRCTELQYYNKYINNIISNQLYHYVMIDDADINKIRITDSYILSNPKDTFCGYVGYNTLDFGHINFTHVNTVNFRGVEINKKKLIIKIINEYWLSNTLNEFNQFSDNIVYLFDEIQHGLNFNENKRIIFEMGYSLLVSGIFVTRIIFAKYISDIIEIEDGLSDISLLIKKYDILKFLLIKAYVKPNTCVLQEILKTIDYIKNKESEVLFKICIDLC